MHILVLNCGSSSIKYKFFNMDDRSILAWGRADRVNQPGTVVQHCSTGRGEMVRELPGKSPGEVLQAIFELLTGPKCGCEIAAVGHRVVHGGEHFQRPVFVDDRVIEALEQCSKLAPLHNPANLLGIKACRQLLPHARQVAVFDTAFHHTMPKHAYIYPLPLEFYNKYRIRKYGFHGISHKYVAGRATARSKNFHAGTKIITCHLGSGASLCAIRGGRSLDTTMGFTPLGGLMMGTRCGDIDPAVISYLAETKGVTLPEVMDILNYKSGALGISGVSGDFRDLENLAERGHRRARLALEMFAYIVAKGIGSLVPVLNGLDILVFTAGIGENSPRVRSRICARLGYLGLILDEKKNAIAGGEMEISKPQSRVQVMVIPTDEEQAIAEDVWALIKGCA